MVKIPESNQTLEQSVVPHNDFFSAQFLIPFAVAGMHSVSTNSQSRLDQIHFNMDKFNFNFLVPNG
jgi:hypothetical protein